MILAREEVVGALLGLLVELAGFQPCFVTKRETAVDAIKRGEYRVVVIDCDHSECEDFLIESIRESGAIPILFSPSRMERELRTAAARYGTSSFTLPTNPETFTQLLQG